MLATDPETSVTRPWHTHPRACPQTDDVGRAPVHLAQRARRHRALDRTLPPDTAVWKHT